MLINEFFIPSGRRSSGGYAECVYPSGGLSPALPVVRYGLARDFAAGTDESAQTLLTRAAEYPTRHLVVTGGEPMVQPGLKEFLSVFAEAGYLITLETAGLRCIADLPLALASISPKLSNTSPDTPEADRLNPDAIRQLTALYPYQLKFVVDRPTTSTRSPTASSG